MNYTKAEHNEEHTEGDWNCRWCTQQWRAESIRLYWTNCEGLYDAVQDIAKAWAKADLHPNALFMRLRRVMYEASQQDRALFGLGGVDSNTVLRMAAAEAAAELLRGDQ